ncbi:hypothetical protein FVO59_12030 [Microbacterium esteraromaticum]|uniref:Minor tail protein n=1 Tax=Microbacterium esteraromaticum TaxID=57043 RepID=A0A7D7WHR1_9MICO|nr:hypothetical protein [Microbacterium esteraromaticum]QMU97854.1 hypothetical protein FVO59_12030 [Microbacterium esteraromaticum]
MTTRWSFELLDSEDRPIGELDGVTGGRAEIVAQSALGGSGRLVVDGRQNIDWASNRVRAWFHDGDRSWPVGTYMFASPTDQHSGLGVTTHDVGLLTKMNVPAEDKVEARFSIAAGTEIIPAAVDLLTSTGETRVASTSSDATLTAALTWPAGTSKLGIINDLLQAAGYWSLWCDGSGQFRIEPYVDPQNRSITHRFAHGEESLHFPDWSREQNLADVPNRFLAIGRGDEENPPLIGIAKNDDPTSPFSRQARGRWITATEEGVEAESQQIIDQYAARKLRDLMDPVARISVSHAMLDLNPNDLVEFIPEDGVTRLATIQRMSMSFTPFTDIDAEWRQVL